MVRNLVVLADGTEIFSGAKGSAVVSLELTESVSNGTELAPGAVCSAMAELILWDADGLQINAGDPLTLYTVDEAGQRPEYRNGGRAAKADHPGADRRGAEAVGGKHPNRRCDQAQDRNGLYL